MEPSDCSRHLLPRESDAGLFFCNSRHPGNFSNHVKHAFIVLHSIKMLTDDIELSFQCQELINTLFKKFPGVTACPE